MSIKIATLNSNENEHSRIFESCIHTLTAHWQPCLFSNNKMAVRKLVMTLTASLPTSDNPCLPTRQVENLCEIIHCRRSAFWEGGEEILEFKLRTSHLLSRLSTTWTTPSVFFTLVIFWTGSRIFAWASLDTGLPHSWDKRCMPPCHPAFLSR
jgi:hypothetical protein